MPNRPHGITALAAILLASGIAAAASADSALQGKLDALAQQIHLRYQDHGPSLVARRETVRAALDAWNQAANQAVPADQDRAAMADWLEQALQAVMPGGSGVLPEVPEFVGPVVMPSLEVIAAQPSATEQPSPVTEPEASAPVTAILQSSSMDLVRQNDTANLPKPQKQSPFAGPRATRRAVAKPTITEPAPERSKWSRHPAAAPLEWRDPFVDDPQASPNPLRSGVRTRSLRPTFSRRGEVGVNLTQLAADIRGYNLAVRSLQQLALQLKPADLGGLRAVVEELERLEEQRQFLDLYRAGLSRSERNQLPDSPSIELVRELARRKVSDSSEKVGSSRPGDRSELEQIRDRLATLKGRSGR